LIVALIGALIWLLWPKAPAPVRASLVAEAAPADTSGFARATGSRLLAFPADDGPHDAFQTEWWYYTGNLTAANGEHFGYQLTFFRRALAPPDQWVNRPSDWGTDQVYMAHLALTDVSSGKHYAFEQFARGAAGLAGAQADPFRVWLEDWEVASRGLKSTSDSAKSAEADWGTGGPVRLRAVAGEVALDLILTDLKAPVLQGDRGYSRKGTEPGNASYYYSLPRIATAGVVTVNGRTFNVDGLSWMDHEWSTSALGSDLVGWDWFSVQLDDGSELMVYLLRQRDGTPAPFSSGTLIAPDGTTRPLRREDVTVQVAGHWRSPHTGADYPAGWVLSVPSAGLRLTITPWLADQEMDLSFVYWEGAVKVAGTRNGQPVMGNGYVELTGYAGSMQGQF